jgi:hypothetical protein
MTDVKGIYGAQPMMPVVMGSDWVFMPVWFLQSIGLLQVFRYATSLQMAVCQIHL